MSFKLLITFYTPLLTQYTICGGNVINLFFLGRHFWNAKYGVGILCGFFPGDNLYRRHFPLTLNLETKKGKKN